MCPSDNCGWLFLDESKTGAGNGAPWICAATEPRHDGIISGT